MLPPVNLTVEYQYLDADECERLKDDVRDRAEEFSWGTHGPNGIDPLLKSNITDLSTQHLENILITQRHLDNKLAAAILMLLKKRYSRYGSN